MNDIAKKQLHQKGVSIIILLKNGAKHLDRLLASYFTNNTHHPFEIIIMDIASTDDTEEVIHKYAENGFIVHIICDQSYTYAVSNNFAAQKAVYANLLFLNNGLVYTDDVLPKAIKKLADPLIGAVGVRLDDDPSKLPKSKPPGVHHAGITFKLDAKDNFYRPFTIKYDTLAEAEELKSGFYPAVTEKFLLCHKDDFKAVGGFYVDYEDGLEAIDFCLQLQNDLEKRCYCLNDLALLYAAPEKNEENNSSDKQRQIEHNKSVFKRRMDPVLKNIVGVC